MSNETMKSVMAALAGVAEAVGNLRALLPAGSDMVDEVAQKVAEMSGRVLEKAMLGEFGSPGGRDGTEAALLRQAERELVNGAPYVCGPKVKASKPKGGRPRKTLPGRAAGKAAASAPKAQEPDASEKTAQVMRVCPDCGQSYLRTGNSQKRCKACGSAKARDAQAAWKRDKAAGQDTSGRLAQIRAANERLDRIPGRED